MIGLHQPPVLLNTKEQVLLGTLDNSRYYLQEKKFGEGQMVLKIKRSVGTWGL